MLIAMALTATLCIGIGSFPAALYSLLPHPVAYEPYTASHVIDQMQLLVFSALAFSVLMRTGIYPPELKSVNLDFDWIYRRAGPALYRMLAAGMTGSMGAAGAMISRAAVRITAALYRNHGPEGILARTWPTGSMALWAMVLLLAYLVIYYL
jgi:multicomponent Na+:H+ antiporter subunit D